MLPSTVGQRRPPVPEILSHEAGYHGTIVAMLELIWGDGYMAPGGPGNVGKLLEGTGSEGKLSLDFGCGIGGPAIDMVKLLGISDAGEMRQG